MEKGQKHHIPIQSLGFMHGYEGELMGLGVLAIVGL
jgi:hypothetical protein